MCNSLSTEISNLHAKHLENTSSTEAVFLVLYTHSPGTDMTVVCLSGSLTSSDTFIRRRVELESLPGSLIFLSTAYNRKI